MTAIRPLQASDLPQVARLLTRAFGYTRATRELDLTASFRRIFLDNPWVDPTSPSLVYEGQGRRVVGFVGSMPRRMMLDGTIVRVTCSTGLAVDEQAGPPGAGALLLGRMLRGPQDATIADWAESTTSAMWRRLGGVPLPVRSLTWLRPLRPAQIPVALLRYRSGRAARSSSGHAPLRLLSGWPPGKRLRATSPGFNRAPLAPADIVAHLPRLAEPVRLRPAYDEPFLRWLLDELDGVRSRGRTVGTLLRDSDGAVVGWYVGKVHPSRAFQSLQLVARSADRPRAFAQMVYDAQQLGAVAVYGRGSSDIIDALDSRTVLFRQARYLLHSRDDALATAIRDGDALVTGLEGETWLHR